MRGVCVIDEMLAGLTALECVRFRREARVQVLSGANYALGIEVYVTGVGEFARP